MIAQTLALVLVLASPGARPALEPQPDNAVRARRGLLPRKAAKARPASRVRRAVVLPQAPSWLGEPGQVAEPVSAPLATGDGAAPVVAAGLQPVVDPPPEVATIPPEAVVPPEAAPEPVATAPAAGAPAAPEAVPAQVDAPLVVALAALPPPPDVAAGAVLPGEVPEPVSAALEGVEVSWLLVRRVAEDAEAPGVNATLSGPELEVFVVHRPPDAAAPHQSPATVLPDSASSARTIAE